MLYSPRLLVIRFAFLRFINNSPSLFPNIQASVFMHCPFPCFLHFSALHARCSLQSLLFLGISHSSISASPDFPSALFPQQFHSMSPHNKSVSRSLLLKSLSISLFTFCFTAHHFETSLLSPYLSYTFSDRYFNTYPKSVPILRPFRGAVKTVACGTS